jgi:hypothetical protein
MKTKRRPKAAKPQKKKTKKRVSKKEPEIRAKLEAEQKQKARPFAGIMSKIRKGQSLTAEEKIRLDRAIKMARRGSKNQWGH